MCTTWSGSKILMNGEIDSFYFESYTLPTSVKPYFLQSDLRFPSALESSAACLKLTSLLVWSHQIFCIACFEAVTRRLDAPQGNQCLLSHFLASLGAQEETNCTSMLWSIDSCQNRVSADQCHLTVPRVQVSTHRGRVFFEVIRWQITSFKWS